MSGTRARGRAGITARLPSWLWLITVWVALWGDLTPANVLGGLGVVALIAVVFPGTAPGPASRVRPLAVLFLGGWFAVKLVEATLAVSREVLRWRPRIAEGIVAVRLGHVSPAVATLIANAITLTPGTLTLDVDDGRDGSDDKGTVLYVHCLHANDPAAVRADLQRLARLALAAFPGGDRGAAAARPVQPEAAS